MVFKLKILVHVRMIFSCIYMPSLCLCNLNIQRWYEHKKEGKVKSFSEHLVSKKIYMQNFGVHTSCGCQCRQIFLNLTLFHLCQTYSYIIKHVKYALLNILLHRIYLFIPNHVPIITCILFAASLVVKM